MTADFRVQATSLPANSAIAAMYPGAHLADAFANALPPGTTLDVERLARAALGQPPRWERLLLAVRDAAMAPLGVKTSTEIGRQLQASTLMRPVLIRSGIDIN